MRMAIVSTYRPRPCGIAVFSSDLRAALLEADSSLSVESVSIVRDDPLSHPPEVVTTIRQDVAGDYAAAASELNRDVDVVLVEHTVDSRRCFKLRDNYRIRFLGWQNYGALRCRGCRGSGWE